MRVRVPVLLTSVLAAGIAAAVTVPAMADAAPVVVAVPSAAGDFVAMTAMTVPIVATRPAGSLVLRGAETSLRSSSPSDVRLTGTDSVTGARVLLSFTAPTGKPFFVKRSTGSGAYDLAARPTGRKAGATASWNGRSCLVDSGTLSIQRLTSGPGGVTSFQANYALACQAGTRLQGVIGIGYGDEVRYSSALATGVGPRNLGALALGTTTRVELPFTYRGVPAGEGYAGGPLSYVPTSDSGYDVAPAPDVALIDNGCVGGGLTDGQVCTVVVDVHPTTRGVGAFFVELGSSIGGYTAVVFSTTAPPAVPTPSAR